jgi:hypothetical protein
MPRNGRSIQEIDTVHAYNRGFDRGYAVGLDRHDLIKSRILMLVNRAQRALKGGNATKAQTLLDEIRQWTMRLDKRSEPNS